LVAADHARHEALARTGGKASVAKLGADLSIRRGRLLTATVSRTDRRSHRLMLARVTYRAFGSGSRTKLDP